MILTTIFLLFSSLFPQFIEVQHLDTSDGLSLNTMDVITEDQDHFLWIGTSYKINRFDGHEFKHYEMDSLSQTNRSNLKKSFAKDLHQNLWVGTLGSGLYFYDNIQDQFKPVVYKNTKLSTKDIVSLRIDCSNNLWIATQDHGVYKGNINRINTKEKKIKISIQKIIDPLEAPIVTMDFQKNDLWIATRGRGAYKWSTSQKKIIKHLYYKSPILDTKNTLWDIYCNDQEVWFTSEGGLLYWDETKQKLSVLFPSVKTRTLCCDRDSTLWLGTQEQGLYYLTKNNTSITQWKSITQYPNLSNKQLPQNILGIYCDPSNTLWIGTWYEGMFKIKLSDNNFQFINPPYQTSPLPIWSVTYSTKSGLWASSHKPGVFQIQLPNVSFESHKYLAHSTTSCIYKSKQHLDSIFVGTWEKGIYIYSEKDNSLTPLEDKEHHLFGKRILDISEDSHGTLFISTNKGAFYLSPENSKIQPIMLEEKGKRYSSIDARSIIPLNDSTLIVGCFGLGVKRVHFNLQNQSTYSCENFFQQNISSSSKYIRFLTQTPSHRVVIGSEGGIVVSDIQGKHIERYTESNGLSNNIIASAIEDNQEQLWVGTYKGLSVIDYSTHKVRNYLDQVAFCGSSCRDSSHIYMGSNKGVVCFSPQQLNQKTFSNQAHLTSLTLLNKEIKPREEIYHTVPLKCSITHADTVFIPYQCNMFSFRFSSPMSKNEDNISYQYKLKGFDTDWQKSIGEEPIATYTNLPSGVYTLKIRALKDGIHSLAPETQTTLVILTPWYKTYWAWSLYIIIFVGVVWCIIRFFIQKQRLKQQLYKERLEKNKIKEVNDLKIQFYTHISHELRTPLTLISGPLESLSTKILYKEQTDSLINIALKNTQRLIQLVNELLDFRKTEVEKMNLNLGAMDFNLFIKDQIELFRSMASQKQIQIELQLSDQEIHGYWDEEKLEKVMTNLLSNAFKFTSQKGIITIKTEQVENTLKCSISDTGIGISAVDLPHIFDHYYTASHKQCGTGIGLALSQKLVRLHNGDINVFSTEGKGSTFVFTLPLEAIMPQPDLPKIENSCLSIKSITKEIENTTATQILIVDDNDEIRSYLKHELGNNYTILEAHDGTEALQLAINEKPHLIISDVMMDKMDGMELCKKLKEEIQTSHIPIILLTAKTENRDKINGIKNGADAYIEKPFSMELLRAQAESLLERYQNYVSQQLNSSLAPADVYVSSLDEQLVGKIIKVMEDKLSDPDFSIRELAYEVCMSHDLLSRKIKTLTGQTGIAFIRSFRLKRAAQLLVQNAGNISDIMYETGFKTLPHFSRSFKKEFDCSPREYQQKMCSQEVTSE